MEKKKEQKNNVIIDINMSAELTQEELIKVIFTQSKIIRRHEQLLSIIKLLRTILLDPNRSNLKCTVLEKIYSQVPCDQISILLFNQNSEYAKIECSIRNGIIEEEKIADIPVKPFLKQELLNGAIIYKPDLHADDFADMYDWDPSGKRFLSCLVLPILIKGDFLGVVMLSSDKKNFFSEEDIDFLLEVINPLSIIIYQQNINTKYHNVNQILEKEVSTSGRQLKQVSLTQNAILENSDTGIIFIGDDGKISLLNFAFESIINLPADKLIGQDGKAAFDSINIYIYSGEESNKPVKYEDIINYAAKTGHFQGKGTLTNRSNDSKYILLTATALYGSSDELVGFIIFVSDITRLRAVENELQERTNLLTTFFESASSLHCIVNKNGYFMLLNPLWEQVLGYTLSELMAKPFYEFLHPEDRLDTLKVFEFLKTQKALKTNSRFINRYRCKDGRYRILQWTSSEYNDVLVSSAIDITEQQLMQKRIRRANQRLKLATRAAQQGIWEYNLSKDRFKWDTQTRVIYGVKEDDITEGFRFADLINIIHPDDRAQIILDYQNAETFRSFTRVTRIVYPDKSIKHVETHGVLVRDEQGRPVRAVGIAQDVTARMQAQEVIRQSEERFRQIADNVDEGFFLFTLTPFSIIYANKAFERICGLPAATINEIDEKRFDIVLPEDRAKVITFLGELSDKKGGEAEFRIGTSSDAYVWVLLRVFEHAEEGKTVRYVGLLRDITTQKEKEILLQEALVREQELSRQKSRFVSTASHEFRTPLMTIQSSVDIIRFLIAKSDSPDKQRIYSQLDKIQHQVFNFSGLLSDLLALGKAESGSTVIRPDNISLDDLCREVIRLNFSDRRDERFVDYSVLGTPVELALDKSLISRVIVNLLSNAFKFSKTNPVLCLDFRDSSQVILTIRDEGIGIPQKDQGSLFQTFYRATNVTAIQGTGLGLVIARQLIELHHGTITVESLEGEGTTFTVKLPVKRV